MKVHEQEWHVCDLDHRVVENAEDMVVADIRVPPHDGGEDVAHFIAAAPDMARALMTVGMPLGAGGRCWCASIRAHHVSPSRACVLATDALRKAGVL